MLPKLVKRSLAKSLKEYKNGDIPHKKMLAMIVNEREPPKFNLKNFNKLIKKLTDRGIVIKVNFDVRYTEVFVHSITFYPEKMYTLQLLQHIVNALKKDTKKPVYVSDKIISIGRLTSES